MFKQSMYKNQYIINSMMWYSIEDNPEIPLYQLTETLTMSEHIYFCLYIYTYTVIQTWFHSEAFFLFDYFCFCLLEQISFIKINDNKFSLPQEFLSL